MRIKGIDSIRFFCAIIVVLGHFGGPPLFNSLNESIFWQKALKGVYANLFNGPAAVIVFFVISGFVIHFPYVQGKVFKFREFILKRYIRLCIPMAVIALIAIGIDEPDDLGIFWSLYAELIYYTLYPVLIKIKNNIGFIRLIIFTYLLGYAVIWIYPYKSWNNFVDLGNGVTWLIGLPSWLIGVYLAEHCSSIVKGATISFAKLNLYRLGVFIGSVFLSIAKFHLNVSYTVSLNLFAILIYFWLYKEIGYYLIHKPNRFMEWGGTWSYSLYICHIIGLRLLTLSGLLPSSPWALWCALILFVLVFSYVFFLLVEKPSHIFVKKLRLDFLNNEAEKNQFKI